MTYQFESPGRLEERIAANMADESEDLSLGVGRRLSSFASMSIATDENSFSRSRQHESFQDTRQDQERSPWTNPSTRRNDSLREIQAQQQSSPWRSSSRNSKLNDSIGDSEVKGENPWSSSKASDSFQEISIDQQSPLKVQSQHSSPVQIRQQDGTSTPKASRPDQERMKAYLINSVKNVNPLRQAQLRNMTPRRRIGDTSLRRTPLSGPSRLRLGADDATADNESDSFVSDVSSTKDLTVPAKFTARANTSLPDVSTGDGIATSNARVDPIRLQGYLHKINLQLESENVTLREEKEALKRQFNRTLMDCERLRMQIEAREEGPKEINRINQGTMTHNDEMEYLRKEIESLRVGQDELNEMLDERDAELEAAQLKLQEGQDSEVSLDRIQELESKLAEAQNEQVNHHTTEKGKALMDRVRELEDSVADKTQTLSQQKTRIDQLRMQAGQNDEGLVNRIRELEDELAEERLSSDQQKSRIEQLRLLTGQKDQDLMDRIQELEDELAEERLSFDQQRARFEQRIQQAMTEAVKVQADSEKKLFKEISNLKAELEKFALTTTRTGESEEQKVAVNYEEREAQILEALREAQEVQDDLEQRLEEDMVAYEEMENELETVKEDLMRCEEELNGAKDQIMDIQIAKEEKESDNIKLNMQLQMAKESPELHQLREKVAQLKTQLEAVKDQSVRHITPMHKNISFLRRLVDTPKSPAELSSASWLNHESSLGDKSVLRYLQELRVKVGEAHAETDEKLAGLGGRQLAQKMDIMTDVASLEADLRRVREESKRFGLELERMRAEQEWTSKQALEDAKHSSQVNQLQKSLVVMQQRDTSVRVRHHAECQGLLLQIRYEKAKYMRESDLRSDLIQQKGYILGVLGGMQLVDETTSRFLADIQRSHPKRKNTRAFVQPKASKFKVVANTVVAICRMRIMAQHWQKTVEVKKVLREAHKAAKLIR